VFADAGSTIGGGAVIGLLILIGLYFLPTIIAAVRHVPNVGSVVVINLFLGWTLVGWVVALAMAARSIPSVRQQHINVYPPQQPQYPAHPPPLSGEPLTRQRPGDRTFLRLRLLHKRRQAHGYVEGLARGVSARDATVRVGGDDRRRSYLLAASRLLPHR